MCRGHSQEPLTSGFFGIIHQVFRKHVTLLSESPRSTTGVSWGYFELNGLKRALQTPKCYACERSATMILTMTLPHWTASGSCFRPLFEKSREAWSICLYLPRILLTQPWLTRSCLEMSQGLTPWWASSTILWRTTSGSGRPFTKTPPSWFTPPCPETDQKQKARERVVRTSHTGVETLLWAPRVPLIRNGCGLVILSLGSDHAGYMNTSDCFLKLTLAFVHLQPVIWATDSKYLHTMFPLVTSIFFIILFNNGIYEDLKLYQGQNLLYTWCWGLR